MLIFLEFTLLSTDNFKAATTRRPYYMFYGDKIYINTRNNNIDSREQHTKEFFFANKNYKFLFDIRYFFLLLMYNSKLRITS